MVKQGITIAGLRYAALSCTIDYWHPVTWISHMLDCQLFGLNPGGHHLTNLIFHLLNVALLYWLILQMVNNPTLAFCVAALWGLHPLRVESVAWITERKDVLSGFFFLLVLNLYILQYKKPTTIKQVFCLVLFCIGLATKNMLITLPVVLILLDYWPLNRFSKQSAISLLKEKLPYILLSCFSVLMTIVVPITVPTVDRLPQLVMLQNAFSSFVIYLYQWFIPINLVAPYPDSPILQPMKLVGAIACLVLLSLGCWRIRKLAPVVTVGWFWCLVMLIPPAGFIQFVSCPHADRYTYLPQIGLSLAIVSGFVLFFSRYRRYLKLASTISLIWFLWLIILSYQQLGHWKTSSTLWNHDISTSDNNYIAYNNRGVLLAANGDLRNAEKDFWTAQYIKPTYANAYCNLGLVAYKQGNMDKARFFFQKALEINPKLKTASSNLEHLNNTPK